MILTHRDLMVLKYVFENRVSTTEQLKKRFFKNCNASATRRRLRILTTAGLLKPNAIMLNGKATKYYSVTEKAFSKTWEKWPFEIDKPKLLTESPAHDLRLVNVRQMFEEFTIFENFYPENLLQSSGVLQEELRTREAYLNQSDGILLLKDKDDRKYNYAVELEISKKAPDRYERKLSGYYNTGQLDGVIYICANQEIINSVVKADEKARTDQDSILYYALEGRIQKLKDKYIFRSPQGGALALY